MALFDRSHKTVIAMAHIGALPGSPLYDAGGGMDRLVEGVARDVEQLQAGGVDAIMFGNENDRPYELTAAPESIAAMTAVVAAIKPMLKVPFGVNFLWDPYATVAIAAATGASFAREIFTGVFASDMGLWAPNAAKALRLRRTLARPELKLLFNVNAEFAASLDSRSIALRAKSAVFSSWRTSSWSRAPLPASRSKYPTSPRCARRCRIPPCWPIPASTSTMSTRYSAMPTAVSSAPISSVTATLGMPSMAPACGVSWTSSGASTRRRDVPLRPAHCGTLASKARVSETTRAVKAGSRTCAEACIGWPRSSK